MVRNPIDSVRTTYEKFDLPFRSEYEERLREHISSDRSAGHGKHIYDKDEFGIDDLDLPNQFREYRERFGDLLPDQ